MVKSFSKDDSRIPYFNKMSKRWDLGELSVKEFYHTISTMMELNEENFEEEFYGKIHHMKG